MIIYRENLSHDKQPVSTVRIVGAESLDAFKQLVQRACNTWTDAPPEIKEFADMVTNGQIFQNYGGTD
jgi:hypothetical protein